LSIASQRASPYSLGSLCPERSYARKNLAYLDVIARGANVVVETDDDNFPYASFWHEREESVTAHAICEDKWVNVYAYFAESFIWPRGLPLEHAREAPPLLAELSRLECRIQQGLADMNPDVDAVYRMLFPLPVNFNRDAGPVALSGAAWCPFNSQNTTFFYEVFPLLYLPAHCSFRMTDIWRSFVALRILPELGQSVLFYGPSVWQDRNQHNLHHDFCEEIAGYKHNNKIRSTLRELDLSHAPNIFAMMHKCYRALVSEGWIGTCEMSLLEAWFSDLGTAGYRVE
jgi:hypothetical protein